MDTEAAARALQHNHAGAREPSPTGARARGRLCVCARVQRPARCGFEYKVPLHRSLLVLPRTRTLQGDTDCDSGVQLQALFAGAGSDGTSRSSVSCPRV